MKQKPQRKKTRAEREMEALLKRTKRTMKPSEPAPRYVDNTAARDWDIMDMEADALFREMKRREF